MEDFVFNLIDKAMPFVMIGLVILVVVLTLAIPFVIIDRGRRHDKFMTQCLEDRRKEYECVAMWRAGESRTVPIIIPVH